jgi:coproporphyrinogen III oxidase
MKVWVKEYYFISRRNIIVGVATIYYNRLFCA